MMPSPVWANLAWTLLSWGYERSPRFSCSSVQFARARDQASTRITTRRLPLGPPADAMRKARIYLLWTLHRCRRGWMRAAA